VRRCRRSFNSDTDQICATTGNLINLIKEEVINSSASNQSRHSPTSLSARICLPGLHLRTLLMGCRSLSGCEVAKRVANPTVVPQVLPIAALIFGGEEYEEEEKTHRCMRDDIYSDISGSATTGSGGKSCCSKFCLLAIPFSSGIPNTYTLRVDIVDCIPRLSTSSAMRLL
jgi:hypothetical protein